MAGIDQKDPDATGFQQFKQRNPVNPGGFHGHRVYPVLHQPIRQGLQVWGEGAKTAHRVLSPIRRDGGPDFPAANVYPGGVGMHDAQRVQLGRGFISFTLTFTTFTLAHAHLLKDWILAEANRLPYD